MPHWFVAITPGLLGAYKVRVHDLPPSQQMRDGGVIFCRTPDRLALLWGLQEDGELQGALPVVRRPGTESPTIKLHNATFG